MNIILRSRVSLADYLDWERAAGPGDLRVKPDEYGAVPSLLAYLILPQEGPEEATVLRRSAGWAPEAVAGDLALPEIGVTVALADIYGV